MPISFFTIKQKILEIWNHAGFQKYFRNTGWMFCGKIVAMLFSFISTIFLVRYLQPEKYGALNYAISFVGLFSFISNLGMQDILYRDLIRYPKKENEYFGTVFLLRTLGSLLSFLMILLSFLFINNSIENVIIILIISFSFFLQPMYLPVYYFQAQARSKIIAINTLIVNFVLSLIKILLVVFNFNLIVISFVFLLEPFLYAVLYGVCYYKDGGRFYKWKFKLSLAFNILSSSWPLMFSSACLFIYSRIDQIMIKFYLNDYWVGIYSVAAQLSEYWYFIPTIIVSAIFPAIVNSKLNNLDIYKKRVRWLLVFMFIISLVFAIFISLLSKSIIVLIYGPNYINSIRSLQIYVWGGIGMSLNVVASQLLITENKTKILFFNNLISMLFNVFLNLILIPRYGINGAAFATLISYSILPITYLFFIKSEKLFLNLNKN
jgi:O-antigen/teichoic acid export membrane protein